VFRIAAICFTEYAEVLEDAGQHETIFERLTREQKHLAILIVARALLDPATDPPEITAVLAGTVAAIYDHLQTMIDLEIDEDRAWTFRRMVLEAAEPPVALSPTSGDLEAWSEMVEALRDTVLEDHDFDLESLFLDVPPEEAAALKALMRIPPDYFVTPIDDPSPQGLKKIREELRSLLSQG
jgi:hypothetical protein